MNALTELREDKIIEENLFLALKDILARKQNLLIICNNELKGELIHTILHNEDEDRENLQYRQFKIKNSKIYGHEFEFVKSFYENKEVEDLTIINRGISRFLVPDLQITFYHDNALKLQNIIKKIKEDLKEIRPYVMEQVLFVLENNGLIDYVLVNV